MVDVHDLRTLVGEDPRCFEQLRVDRDRSDLIEIGLCDPRAVDLSDDHFHEHLSLLGIQPGGPVFYFGSAGRPAGRPGTNFLKLRQGRKAAVVEELLAGFRGMNGGGAGI